MQFALGRDFQTHVPTNRLRCVRYRWHTPPTDIYTQRCGQIAAGLCVKSGKCRERAGTLGKSFYTHLPSRIGVSDGKNLHAFSSIYRLQGGCSTPELRRQKTMFCFILLTKSGSGNIAPGREMSESVQKVSTLGPLGAGFAPSGTYPLSLSMAEPNTSTAARL